MVYFEYPLTLLPFLLLFFHIAPIWMYTNFVFFIFFLFQLNIRTILKNNSHFIFQIDFLPYGIDHFLFTTRPLNHQFTCDAYL
jgi:hypothetical protein